MDDEYLREMEPHWRAIEEHEKELDGRGRFEPAPRPMPVEDEPPE